MFQINLVMSTLPASRHSQTHIHLKCMWPSNMRGVIWVTLIQDYLFSVRRNEKYNISKIKTNNKI